MQVESRENKCSLKIQHAKAELRRNGLKDERGRNRIRRKRNED